ncbi:uncharacterized protein EI90DRAFT_3081580 [Cantharellus anzutake]|uniref:uncharacterized protein n=1 Tax=Cantharellus anzutake TaxID=1750568 RepID=UPI001906FCA1|nr:uncharacterized protein EI90DRAFT_3081580 [Cantharellus anzutake]KAF8319826.1 hypothetical protein EI90DRAFT_3081580 [Cantharellus anzutake]
MVVWRVDGVLSLWVVLSGWVSVLCVHGRMLELRWCFQHIPGVIPTWLLLFPSSSVCVRLRGVTFVNGTRFSYGFC